MGQLLEKKKKIAKRVGIGAGSVIAIFGVVSGVSSISQNMKEAAAERAKAEAEQTATLNNLIGADTTLLGGQGYTVNRRLSRLGGNCGGDGQTDGQGYQGASTAIAYDVTQGDQRGSVCVAHAGPKPLVSAFAVEAPPPVVAPTYNQPGPSYSEQEPEYSQLQVEELKARLTTLMQNDISAARSVGFKLEAAISDNFNESTGLRCNDDAFAVGQARDWDIAVVYRGRFIEDNAPVRVCMDHNTSKKPQGMPSGYKFVEL